jgi:hypothetical protein
MRPATEAHLRGEGAAEGLTVRGQLSPRTAAKWSQRYRVEGPVGMADRSSRPRSSPAKTPPQVVRQIVRLRWRQRLGPVPIAGQLGMPASTVHAVLVRCRINRLRRIDRVTGEPIRRYEHDRPGELIHVDVTKFGNIPDGGGSRYVGKQQGDRNPSAAVARTGTPRSKHRGPSTAPSLTAGPTPATTTQRQTAGKPCQPGSTSTITTEPTARSEPYHPPAG